MKRLLQLCLLSFIIFFCSCTHGPYSSGDLPISHEYPKSHFILGIGRTDKTDSLLKDQRVAEIYARLEIAKQIKVRIKEEVIDKRCETEGSSLFNAIEECSNEFKMIVEESVDEFLVGSKIVRTEVDEDTVYAVAVLPRNATAKGINRNVEDLIGKIKENIERAKEGDKDAIEKAQEELMKAVIYDKEKEIIEGIKSNASEVIDDLEKEIEKMSVKR